MPHPIGSLSARYALSLAHVAIGSKPPDEKSSRSAGAPATWSESAEWAAEEARVVCDGYIIKGARAREVEERLRHVAAGDRLVRAVALSVRLLDERRPQLLLAHRVGASAEREPRTEREVLAPRLRSDGQPIVDGHDAPSSVKEEADAVAAGGVARGT